MTDDGPLHARTFGKGSRSALALHCTLAHSGAWKGIGQALSDCLTLTAVDLPGHGRSRAWQEKLGVQDDCMEAVQPFLHAAIDLIGHSFGATVALRLALENTSMVRSLTLIEPVFFALAKANDLAVFEGYLKQNTPFQSAFESGDRALAAQKFYSLWGDGQPWDALPETTRQDMIDRIHLVADQGGALFEDPAHQLVPGRLEQMDVETLLIEGETSPPIISAIHRELARRLPNVRRAVIANLGHMAPIHHPVPVAQEIRALLEVT